MKSEIQENKEREVKGGWVFCEKCGKKLLRRRANGIFVFKFGRNSSKEDVVYMEIWGSLKMKCFRETCSYTNTIHFFPA